MEKDLLSKGLSSRRAEELLEKFGKNEIKEIKRYTLLKILIGQFNNFLMILLIAAAVVSFLIGEAMDGMFILLIVFLNAAFGMYQEFKAENVLSNLKKMTINTIRAIRNGKEMELDSRFLVPGDIFYMEEGTKIPADSQIIRSYGLEVNESSLTGESIPVAKNEHDKENNTVFMGTVVSRGRAYVKVVNTGDRTKFGQIAVKLQQIDEEQTPLQKKLESFTKQIAYIGIGASAIVFVLSFIKEKSLFESFIFAVSLAVAAVPEGLPAVMTITLAIGVERMAKKKAVIRKLNAIEALGSVTVVATDKTGTLTTNQMRVKNIWVDGVNYHESQTSKLKVHAFDRLLLNGVLCSTASIIPKAETSDFDVLGDTTEGAVLILAHNNGLIPETVKSQWKIIDERSFDAVTKRMSVVVSKGKEEFVFTKGAPESILSISKKIMVGSKEESLTENRVKGLKKELDKYARQGLRMIAFSFRKYKKGANIESDQVFLGFVGIADPLRKEIKEAVARATGAGIKVVMITGDNELTAESIGIEAGIIKKGEEILTGKQLEEYSDEELLEKLPNVRIFARTSPMHKHRLVSLFQQLKEVVAVTGDGVNDALALKQADVGVAMGITGTDVAKETAHMIITDDNFASIITAVEEGRNIFNNIKNAIKYLLSCNLSEIIYILGAVIFNLPLLVPIQILYINLATDGLPALSLAFSPPDKEIMTKKPRRSMNIFNRRDYNYIFIVGTVLALLVFITSYPYINSKDALLASTAVFSAMIFTQNFILADIWVSQKRIFSHLHLMKKPIFIVAFLLPLTLQIILFNSDPLHEAFSITSVSLATFAYFFFTSFAIILILELIKKFKPRIF